MKQMIERLVVVFLLISLCACGQKSTAWQEQYDLGVRYLSDGNYEEAIIVFTAAIEIDPKRPEAYISLADAYIGIGDYDEARRVLQEGQEACGDVEGFSRLEDNLSFLQSGEAGIRITELYFDKKAFLAGDEMDFMVSVVYRCPETECILMIGTNTVDHYTFQMMDEDHQVTGSGSYQFHVSVTPVQWDDAYFGIYVNISEADHEAHWTPFDADTLYIDSQGNIVSDITNTVERDADELTMQSFADEIWKYTDALVGWDALDAAFNIDRQNYAQIFELDEWEISRVTEGEEQTMNHGYYGEVDVIRLSSWMENGVDGNGNDLFRSCGSLTLSFIPGENRAWEVVLGDDVNSNATGFPLGILGLHIGDTIEEVYEAVGIPKPFWESAFQQGKIDIQYVPKSQSEDVYIPGWVKLNDGYSDDEHDLSLYCYEDGASRGIIFGFNNGFLTGVMYWNNSLLLQ